MKKIFSCVIAALAAMSCLTSCDEDEKLSMKLQGEWQGEFYACYTCKYKREVEPRKYYAENTYMQFIPNHLFGSTRGTGYEVDFYPDNSPIKYSCYEFDWKIVDQVIEITYFDAPEMNCTIENFRLTYDHFQGIFGANQNTIDLRKMDPWNHEEYTSPYEMRMEAYINDYYDVNCGRGMVRSESELEKINPDDVEIISFGHEKKAE